MAKTLLFNEVLDSQYYEPFGVYTSVALPPPFTLTLGETYKVIWDGTTYESTAVDTSAIIQDSVAIGNGAAFGLPGNGEPFAIVYTPDSDVTFVSLTDTAPNSHEVIVYQNVETGTLLETQEINPFESFPELYGLYAHGLSPSPFVFEDGEKYIVSWDGAEYEVEAHSGVFMGDTGTYIGNGTIAGNPGNDEPFVIMLDENGHFLMLVSLISTESTHSVGIRFNNSTVNPEEPEDPEEPEIPDEDNNTILTMQRIEFAQWNDGTYVSMMEYNAVEPIVGETYHVIWNDVGYNCIAQTYSENVITIGNSSIGGTGEDTGEPFNVGISYQTNAIMITTREPDQHHYIAIYKGARDEPDGIVIRDPLGRAVTYGDYKRICINKASGAKVIYSEGDATYDVPITLDFSNGNQKVEAPTGQLVKTAVISKPDALVPENIIKDVEIAGVVGTAVGETEEIEVELSMADGNQVILPPNEDVGISKVTVIKPETLVPENIVKNVNIAGVVGTAVSNTEEIEVEFSVVDGNQVILPSDEDVWMSKVTITKPNTLIPENIVKDVNIAGVVGTHECSGGSGGDFDTSDEFLKYFLYKIDGENKQIILTQVLYSTIYKETGKYDVTIPNKIGGYDVVVAVSGVR